MTFTTRCKHRAAETSQDSDLSLAMVERKIVFMSSREIAFYKHEARRANRRQAKANIREVLEDYA